MAKLSVNKALLRAGYHAKKGEIEEAQKLYQAVLQAFPNNTRAKQALAALNKPKQPNLTQSPPPDTINQLINLYDQGQLAVVVEHANKLAIKYPNSVAIWNILGAAAARIKQMDKALSAFQRVIAIQPNNAEVYNNIGNVLRDQGKVEKAMASYQKALSLRPDYPEACYNVGIILQDQGKLEEAIASYQKALSLKPNYPDAHSNMGNILQDQGKREEALACYQKTLSLKPDHADAYNNMSVTLRDQGKVEEAILACNKAIAIRPNYAEAHQNLSFLFLNNGRLKEGLDEFEWHWKTANRISSDRHFSMPRWDGKESLKEKTILVWSEMGPGDVVMWLSALKYLIPMAKHCIIECPIKLLSLLKRSFPQVEVRTNNENDRIEHEDFDFHLPAGSLFKHFFPFISSRRSTDAFLFPDPERVKYWKKRLATLGDGPFIGSSWKSPLITSVRLQNYTKMNDWSPLFSIPNITFINLQCKDFKTDISQAKSNYGVDIHNFDELDHYDDLDDVAALSLALDMCVSVSTAVSTITAAVGTPTKMLHWKQSSWNNILFTPPGPEVDVFERNTWEDWSKPFNEIAKDIQSLPPKR